MKRKLLIATLIVGILLLNKYFYDNAMDKCTNENSKEYCEVGLK